MDDNPNVSHQKSDEVRNPAKRERVDRISSHVEETSGKTTFLKGGVALLILYALAAYLFQLPPVKKQSASPVCDNLASSQSETAAMKHEVALVLGPSDTFLDFSSVLETQRDGLLKTLVGRNDTKLTVVLADGSPRVLSMAYIHADPGENMDFKIRDALDTVQNDYECLVSTRVVAGVADKIPSTPGQDILRAMQRGAESLGSQAETRDLLVISNGLQTAGALKLQSGFPSGASGASQAVKQLKQQGALGDLGGANVTWLGLGETDGSRQPRLDTFEVSSLVQLWNAVVRSANGVPVSIAADTIPDTQPDENAISSPVVKGLPDPCVNITATEDGGVRFNPDQSSFVSLDKAKSAARDFAKQIASVGCQTSISVTGYVASNASKSAYQNNPRSGCSLSLERANAFKALLKDAGVLAPIETFAGCKGPNVDWDANGQYRDDLGAKNRIVTVTQ